MVPTAKILYGHCLDRLRELPDCSVHCVVTSPPYWGLRDYKIPPVHWPEVTFSPMAGLPPMVIAAEDVIHGLEPDLWHYIAHEVAVFREVRRVLREDGTLWLNLGDGYAASGGYFANAPSNVNGSKQSTNRGSKNQARTAPSGLKPKDLIGVPWRVALALQADGWYLRSDIIWHKPNPMPESVTDRPTKSHEYIFLLSKNQRYFYDNEAIKEESVNLNGWQSRMRYKLTGRDPSEAICPGDKDGQRYAPKGFRDVPEAGTRNKRSVWTIPSFPFKDAHFATFSPALIRPCILAGTSARGCCPQCGAPWERVVEKTGGTTGSAWNNDGSFPKEVRQTKHSRVAGIDLGNGEYQVKTLGWQPTCECGCPSTQPCTVLDPFLGSGTTAQVSLEEGRCAIGIELNPEYISLGNHRTNVTPALAIA